MFRGKSHSQSDPFLLLDGLWVSIFDPNPFATPLHAVVRMVSNTVGGAGRSTNSLCFALPVTLANPLMQ